MKAAKVWKKDWKGQQGFGIETRVYIETDDGRKGALYLTGNPYQAAGSLDGKITEQDVAAALEFCGGKWRTSYAEDRVAGGEAAKTTKTTVNTNRRPDHCQLCGALVEAGEGSLERLEDEEDIDRAGGRRWVVYHLDAGLCRKNREAAQRERQEQQVSEARRSAEALGLADTVAAETGLAETADWSFDDDRCRRGRILRESTHYRAYRYYESGELVGFVIRRK